MSRRALTLIELLVVLGVIGLLLALLLPAIQVARARAAMGACANKLHQIGLAIHAYEGSNRCFPPGATYWVGRGYNGGPWSWNVILLPNLEQSDLYNSLNLQLHFDDPANTTIVRHSPGIYLCPADASVSDGASGFGGVSNYLGCLGSGLCPGGVDSVSIDSTASDEDGFFGMSPIRARDVTDGLSHTAMVGELVHGANLPLDARRMPIPSLGYTYHFHVSPPTQRRLMDLCEDANFLRRNGGVMPTGAPWVSNNGYTHLFTPGKVSCFGGNLSNVFSPITSSSRHSGGVNLLLADGHVRFISHTIDQEVWRALGSRNGGELISGEF